MNKELHTHLSDAARDIRSNLDYASIINADNEDEVQRSNVDYRLKNVERALTRIEMALKEATIA